MQKQRLSILLNQAMLALFGILFCILGVKKGLGESAGILLFVSGLVLAGLGILRTWLVVRLMKKVTMDEDEDSAH